MTILITGAAGFIGSNLCQALLENGESVVGVDCFTDHYARSIKEQNLQAIVGQKEFAFHEIDLRYDDLESVFDGIDTVVNLAALPGLQWTDVETYLSCNILAVERLVQASRRAGISQFVQASTSSVYGANAVGDESQELCPVSPYGVSKLAAEHLLLAYCRAFDFPVTILRYFSIYGPHQRPDMAYHRFIQALHAGEAITVFGDGKQTRGNTYVADCVAGTVNAIDLGQPGEIYNIGGGVIISLLEAIEIIGATLGVSPTIHYQPARPGDQRHTFADTSKAESELGYRPATEPDIGLPQQITWQVG